MIDPLALKDLFGKTIDSCLADLLETHGLQIDMELQRMYEYMYSVSKLTEICNSFTGMSFEKVRKVICNFV